MASKHNHTICITHFSYMYMQAESMYSSRQNTICVAEVLNAISQGYFILINYLDDFEYIYVIRAFLQVF